MDKLSYERNFYLEFFDNSKRVELREIIEKALESKSKVGFEVVLKVVGGGEWNFLSHTGILL